MTRQDAITIITSDYKVYNTKNGRELRVYQNEKLVGGQISSNFKGTRSNYSFARLLALMAVNQKWLLQSNRWIKTTYFRQYNNYERSYE